MMELVEKVLQAKVTFICGRIFDSLVPVPM
jgi:hypothetical protein